MSFAPATSSVPWPPIDTSSNQVVLCVGRKGSGKSEAARMLYRHWPGADRIVIDTHGDAHPGAGARRLTGEPPAKLPARGDDGKPLNLHYVANPTSATYRDDLDRAVRMALFPRDRRTLLWIDEIGEVTQTNRTPPHLRLALQQGRHYSCSTLMCGPRPIAIDPLCLQQADRVLVYDLPNPADRRRVAETIGWPPGEFDEACRTVRRRGKFWFLTYVAGEHQLYLCPPLPEEWRADPDVDELDEAASS